MFDNLGSAIAITVAARSEIWRAWLKGFRSSTWHALVAPPKTPKAIVERINKS